MSVVCYAKMQNLQKTNQNRLRNDPAAFILMLPNENSFSFSATI